MAYSLSNKCAKYFCKRTVLGQLIVEYVVTFLEHSVFPTACVVTINTHSRTYSTHADCPNAERNSLERLEVN